MCIRDSSRGRVIRQQMLMAVGFGLSDLFRAVVLFQSGQFLEDHAETIELVRWCSVFYDVQLWFIVTHGYCRIFTKATKACYSQKKAGDVTSTVEVTDIQEYWQYNADEDGHDIADEMRHELVLLTALGIFTCAGGSLRESCEIQRSPSGWGEDLTVAGKSTTGGLRPHISFPGSPGKSLDFYDYASHTFAKIRKCLGLTPEEFQEAFKEIVQFLETDDGTQLFESAMFKEILSSGASGSYFYFSPNRRFIVKQVSGGEKETLQSMSEDYLKFCEQNPNTGIQYYGLYAIRLPMCTSKKMYFVVMKNFLYTKPESALMINLTFDLKGATTNRQRLKSRQKIDEVRNGGKGSSLLDWEWMNLGFEMDLDQTAKRALSETLRADLKFLAEQRLLDYSILLGVTVNHRQKLPHCSQRTRLSRFLEDSVLGSKEVIEADVLGMVGSETTPESGAQGEAGASQSSEHVIGDGVEDCTVQSTIEAGDVRMVHLSRGDGSHTQQQLACLEQPFQSVSTGEYAYCIGMIDILEKWSFGWRFQGWFLGVLFRCCRCLGNPRGITAINPKDYALRFDEFFHDQVIRGEQVYDDWKPKDGPTWRPWS
eukprot:TRINITY_DN4273_c0_g1_i1.p1 TRINITY_DN4273_c0_g1~~TRINITY_DN4273_c0_g1_i1.p1  ORF type:complete len:596 (+),score=57.78 TRINITY_DN4273_c0_g1_i1:91-1878(+)